MCGRNGYMYPMRGGRELDGWRIINRESMEEDGVWNIPRPNERGVRKIIRDFEAPDRW